MAKSHSNLKSTPRKTSTQPTERFYTISCVLQELKPHPRPRLTIKGHWLEQIGFYPRLPVIITVEQNKLIIELAIQI